MEPPKNHWVVEENGSVQHRSILSLEGTFPRKHSLKESMDMEPAVIWNSCSSESTLNRMMSGSVKGITWALV